MVKRYSVTLHGHRTSVSLEPEFWAVLKQVAEQNGLSLAALIQSIDDERLNAGLPNGLSSALRLYLLKHLQNRKV
ncbi:MAG: aryl-sulfate sulfotransferase [Rhodospirillaceae bacterium]|nr:aryl-sulfate sulfotransferase [Rhodospirillaceae bacterium]|tara:strand:+ start:189 stop:413 length:225 start_codon:yes stop_codon:yes gene_type:complete